MATFDATLSGSTSTSYISVERADAIFTDTLDFATWDGFTEDQKKQGLNAATMWLETLSYGGSRCGIPSADDPTKPQALLWPRSGVTCEGYTASCELIPYKIERAEALIALQLIQNPGAIIPEGGSGGGAAAGTYVKRQKLGSLEIEYDQYAGTTVTSCDNCNDPKIFTAFPWLKDLLGCWLDTGGVTGGVGLMLRVRS